MGRVDGPVRAAAVAGLFYPAEEAELRDSVQRLLSEPKEQPKAPDAGAAPVRAVIAPHAGYRYSGATAGHAYDALASHKETVERVVVLGPAHRVPLEGIGLTSARAWATPFGTTDVDRDALQLLAGMPGVVPADDAHEPEHSIEVHLPFIDQVFGSVPVVPLVVGRATPQLVAQSIAALWDEGTVVVASSDLSHYLDDETARSRDRQTATAILEGRASDIGPRDACGCLPVGGLLTAATARGLVPRLLDLSTSADATGDTARVVGYGSFAFQPPTPLEVEDRTWLLELASRVITNEIRDGEPYSPNDVEVPESVRRPGASFVTLTRGEELLGCIGTLEPQRALWRDIARNARSAAFDDPRFPALGQTDLEDVSIEISVLSPLEELSVTSAEALTNLLLPGVHGAVVAAEGRRGTFLPEVWRKIPEPSDFVRELTRKACWEEPWVAGARTWRYTTDVFTGSM